jgi:hypothetical protein
MREYMLSLQSAGMLLAGGFANATANALEMAAGSPRRIAVAAVEMAWANATRSALPWLFTTTAVNPTMHAPL